MKKKTSFLSKNTQRGASVMEVIFAIGLVIAVTPFIYTQVSEMTKVVQDVSVAGEITKNRDRVLNYMLSNQSTFTGGLTEIPSTTLENIAPNAIKGVVYQTNIDNNFRNTEIYLVFNVEDSDRYRVANIVKYIGGDAAAVGNDNIAYAKDWSVQLPDEWNLDGNNLVYRITRNFGEDDKTLYLHFGDAGGDLSTMLRDLHMDSNSLSNIADFEVTTLNMGNVVTPSITTDEITAGDILFSNGAIINKGEVNFDRLSGINGVAYGFTTIEAKNLCSYYKQCDFSFCDIDVKSGVFKLGKSIETSDNCTVTGYVKDVHIANDLRANYVGVSTLAMEPANGEYLTLFVSDEQYEGAENTNNLIIGDWSYENTGPNYFHQGPSFHSVKIHALSTNYAPDRHLESIDWDEFGNNTSVNHCVTSAECTSTTGDCSCY